MNLYVLHDLWAAATIASGMIALAGVLALAAGMADNERKLLAAGFVTIILGIMLCGYSSGVENLYAAQLRSITAEQEARAMPTKPPAEAVLVFPGTEWPRFRLENRQAPRWWSISCLLDQRAADYQQLIKCQWQEIESGMTFTEATERLTALGLVELKGQDA